VFESFIATWGEIYETGCKVGSDGYSNPSFMSLSSLISPIFFVLQKTFASIPSVEFILVTKGIVLEFDPFEIILIFLIDPFAFNEFLHMILFPDFFEDVC
jgi:hypothetical protein